LVHNQTHLFFFAAIERNENREIHKIPVNELDSLVANFIIAAKKKRWV
jgi:hypothetical protein